MAARSGRLLRPLLRDRAGNVGMMGALLLPMTLSLAAVGVDMGSIYFERREAQAAADLAAIEAAGSLADPRAAVLASLSRNGFPDAALVEAIARGADGRPLPVPGPRVVVTAGRYETSRATAERFRAHAQPRNAVEVTFARPGRRWFSHLFFDEPVIVTGAVGAAPAAASFSVGSRLASLEGGIANRLLGALLGTEISLKAMDYEALVDARVAIDGALAAVAREVALTAGTYDDALAASIAPGKLAAALATVPGLAPSARHALADIARAGPATRPGVALSRLVDLGAAGARPLGAQVPGMSAEVGVLELLTAAAALANGSNQVAIDLGASVPGLLDTRLGLAIGEPPRHQAWFAFDETGAIVRTAQTRLTLVAELGTLLGVRVRLPVYVEVAFAEARLDDVSCPTGRPDSARVEVAARPGVVEAWIGEIDAARLRDFTKRPQVGPASILRAPLVEVTGSAHAAMANPSPTTLSFTAGDVAAVRAKSVSTRDFTSSLAGSLLSDLSLKPRVLGLGIGIPSNLTGTVGTILAGATQPVDALLGNLLALLGVRLGEADVRVHSVACGRPVLVR
jgi:uncharacterized membrane protein